MELALSLSLVRPAFTGSGAPSPVYDLVLARNGDTVTTRTDEDVSPRS
jgi:hypothetical protein